MLRQQIIEAFGNVNHPGDRIEDHIDVDAADPNDVAGFRSCFVPKTWQTCDVFDLKVHHDLIHLLTDAGFRYWIPAFMIFWITDAGAPGIIPDLIAIKICPEADQISESDNVKAGLFSAIQLRAIHAFFGFCIDKSGEDELHVVMSRLERRLEA